MVAIKHAKVVTGVQNPLFQVSKDEWNDNHLKGTIADVLTDHDKAAHDALGISAASLSDVITDSVHGTKTTIPDAHHPKIHGLAHADHPDVSIANPANAEVLTYEGATALWKNKAPTGGAGIPKQIIVGVGRSFAISAINYFNLLNTLSSTVESGHQTPFCAGTFKKFYARISGNASPIAVTFTLRINDIDTSLTITVPAGQTGIFSVTADVNVNENDIACFGVTSSGGYTITWQPSLIFVPS